MMPAFCPPDCPSPAEPEIFATLRNAPRTDDWVVLHSLDIARHVNQIAGEADFVVLVPGMGAVCLEVKGAKTIRRTADGWYIGRNGTLDARGPFRQASDAMHSLRRALADKRPELGRVLFVSAVVMPYVPFDERSGEWHDWQVIDSQKYNGSSLPDLITGILSQARRHAASCATGKWFDKKKSSPTSQQVQQIADVLRPQFEVNESSRARAKREAEEIRRYTEEQFAVLDAMQFNPRVIFEGPAGTGKTILALEAVRRSALQGNRVLFLCFNRLLARWLANECSPLGDGATVCSLHSYMLRIAGMRSAPPGADSAFWEEALPDQALAELLEKGGEAPYDALVIDEAQDILRGRYLDVLDLSLQAGLRDGHWMMFGDIHGQDIYGSSACLGGVDQDGRLSRTPQYSLRKNCRNTPRVSALVAPFGGISPDYSGVLRPDDGIDPEWRYYRNDKSQQTLLDDALEGLLREGYRRHEIVVLSALSDSHSAAAGLARVRGDLAPYEPGVLGKIRYCSVHAFKGLEARAIVVTDMADLARPEQRTLLYVAVTRSTGRLVLCVSESERDCVVQVMLESMFNGGV
jgi:UvrD-like helicase C-terminal domain/Nuclease-related domain/PhoH-like protein